MECRREGEMDHVHTSFQIIASAGRIAIFLANLVVFGRKQFSTITRLAIDESHDGHVQRGTSCLALASALKLVISFIF